MTHNLSCPLCSCNSLEIQEVLPFAELQALWASSQIAAEKFLPAELFFLHQCQNCWLQFFTPRAVGGADFYKSFSSGGHLRGYYRFSWDYQEIMRHIFNYQISTFLDYGCGEGAFLKSLPTSIDRVGIDFNAPNEESQNLKLIQGDLLSLGHPTRFQGIACVQVLEHLDKVHQHLKHIISFLDDSGYLFLSVPNRDGIISFIENRGKNLDFPPHHLNRWSSETLSQIAKIFDLRLLGVFSEPLSYDHFRWASNMYVGVRYSGSFWQRSLRKLLLLSQEAVMPFSYFQFKNQIPGFSLLGIFQKTNGKNQAH